MALFTRRITGAIGGTTFNIITNDGIAKYSVLLISGSATILGTMTLDSLASTAVPLQVGIAFNDTSTYQPVAATIQIDAGAVVDIMASND